MCTIHFTQQEEPPSLQTSKEKEAVPEWHQAFEVAKAQTSGLVNIVFSHQNVFFKWDHPVIDKPMVITKPAVPSTKLLGLCLELYPSNFQLMLNKDLTRFMQTLSWVCQIQASERQALLVGCIHFIPDIIFDDEPLEPETAALSHISPTVRKQKEIKVEAGGDSRPFIPW